MTEIAGFPVTGIERTLLDVAALVPRRQLGLAVDEALRRRLTTPKDLWTLLDSLGPRGRIGSRALGAIVSVRDDRDARLESPLESDLLDLLRTRGVPLPIPQYLVTEGSYPAGRIDFAYPELRLGIEADGRRWYGPEQREADARRENRLKLLGWTILRFSWWDVHERPELVVSQVRAALTRSSLTTSTVAR